MRHITTLISFLIGMLSLQTVAAQAREGRDLWIRYSNPATGAQGYKDSEGKIVIPAGKYSFCFTAKFTTYAVVSFPRKGFVAIDKREHILYEVFPFDSGPDYVQDGLFRILRNGKIGYAEARTGKVVIEPKFSCAWPFEKGKAKVAFECETKASGEHSTWISKKWLSIDKMGRVVKEH